MTNTNCLNEHATGLIIPPWVIIGKKTNISSEYEDLSTEEVIILAKEPWWLHPY